VVSCHCFKSLTLPLATVLTVCSKVLPSASTQVSLLLSSRPTVLARHLVANDRNPERTFEKSRVDEQVWTPTE